MGERLEYQRKNAKWDQMKLNFDRIKREALNVDVMISPTISIFNLLSISEMHQTMVKENYVRPEDVVPTLLVYPQEFNIQILPYGLKETARISIENHLDWLGKQEVIDTKKMKYVLRQYWNILSYLNHEGNEKARLNFKAKIQKLDALREETFESVFPELASFFESNE
jgi:hypothetical protein